MFVKKANRWFRSMFIWEAARKVISLKSCMEKFWFEKYFGVSRSKTREASIPTSWESPLKWTSYMDKWRCCFTSNRKYHKNLLVPAKKIVSIIKNKIIIHLALMNTMQGQCHNYGTRAITYRRNYFKNPRRDCNWCVSRRPDIRIRMCNRIRYRPRRQSCFRYFGRQAYRCNMLAQYGHQNRLIRRRWR